MENISTKIKTPIRRPRCGRRKIRSHTHGLHFNFIAQSMSPYNHGGLFQSLNNGTPDASQYQNNPRLPGFGLIVSRCFVDIEILNIKELTDERSVNYS